MVSPVRPHRSSTPPPACLRRKGKSANLRGRQPAPTGSVDTSQSRALSPVPSDFGIGTGISNAAEVLPALYANLGPHKGTPPAVVFILVEPYNTVQITPHWGLGPNGLGHAAIALTLDGKTTVMNIVGNSEPAMVNFVSLEDYLLSVGKTAEGCEQGGIYNRSMNLLFIHDVPEAQVRAIRAYYEQIKAESDVPEDQRTAHFAIAAAPLYNAMGAITGDKSTYGNCAIYTSRGLREGGLLKRACMWPKQVFIDLLQSQPRNNVSIVSMPRIKHAKLSEGAGAGNAGFTGMSKNPFTWLRNNWKYWRLSRLADAEVIVPEGTRRAEVRFRQP